MKLPKVPQRTTPGFSFSIVERALFECIAVRRFGKAQIAEVLSYFGEDPPTCVFCGTATIERWDHLVPIFKGGDTMLGNIVPSCARCDDSKRDLPFDGWALSSAPNSPRTRGVADVNRRLARIREYMAKYEYRPRRPEERLAEAELRQFEVLRGDLRKLRRDFDAFIAVYRGRTGLR